MIVILKFIFMNIFIIFNHFFSLLVKRQKTDFCLDDEWSPSMANGHLLYVLQGEYGYM